MARGDLTDANWARLEPLLPKSEGRGRPWKDHRTVLNGILWILRTGAPWRDLPERFGPWQTAYDRFVRWRRDGTWLRLLQALQQQGDQANRLAWEDCAIDGSYIRAHQHAAGAPKSPSQADKKGGGFTPPTKPSVAVAGVGQPRFT